MPKSADGLGDALIDLWQIRKALSADKGIRRDNNFVRNTGKATDQRLVNSAVLIGLIERKFGFNVILTVRATGLAHHAGQVAFPGGRVDASDRHPKDTALREASEEIGLQRRQTEIIGECPPHVTSTGFRIYPFIATILPNFQEKEVAGVFEVPLQFALNPSNFRIEAVRWGNINRRYYVLPHESWLIWGATAAILHGLAIRLHANDEIVRIS